MKNILIAFIFMIVNLSIFGQGNVEFTIIVTDNLGKPQPKLKILAVERSTMQKVSSYTDFNGQANLQLNNGNAWIVSVGDMEKCMLVEAIPNRILEMQKEFVYDLEFFNRKKKQNKNRSNTGYELIEQRINQNTRFEPGKCMLVVRLSDLKGYTLFNQQVDLVSIQNKKIYRAKTNTEGLAVFIVPNNTEYDIDINELKNYSYYDFKDEYIKYMLDLQFEPTKVNEIVKNDTIHQTVTEKDKPSSERALIKINVSGGKKNGNNETVYLRELKSGKVYATKSDESGSAWFLIPNGFIYMVDFRYQKNADGINLLDTYELTYGMYTIQYSPDPKLEYPEKFIPSPENLIITDFKDFLNKQYQKPKDQALIVKLFSAKKINRKSKEAIFVLTLTSSDSYGREFRLPINISLVIDASGSMYSENRAESLKKALWVIGNNIQKGDIVSLVLFDDMAFTIKHIKSNYLKEIEEIIEMYTPGGGTNIFLGIQKGVEDIEKYYDDSKSNRLILLTDGYGVTPPKEITDYVESKYSEGIEFASIGLGDSYNQSLLQLIAMKGNGTFQHVNKSDQLTEAFLDQIEMSFRYLAKDLKIEIYHDKELIFSKLFGHPAKTKGNDLIEFEISKVPYGANKIAFLKFKLKKANPELEGKPLTMKVNYFDPVKEKEFNLEETIKLEWTEETDSEWTLDQEEKKLYAIAVLNQTLKTMSEAYAQGFNEEAKNKLTEGKEQINEIYPKSKPKDVKKLFDEIEKYLKLFYQIEKNEDN